MGDITEWRRRGYIDLGVIPWDLHHGRIEPENVVTSLDIGIQQSFLSPAAPVSTMVRHRLQSLAEATGQSAAEGSEQVGGQSCGM